MSLEQNPAAVSPPTTQTTTTAQPGPVAAPPPAQAPAMQTPPATQPAAPVQPAATQRSPHDARAWEYDPAALARESQPTSPALAQPATQSSATTPASAPPSGLRERFASQGIDVSRYASDEALIADLASYSKQRPQLERYAQLGAQFEPHAQQFSEYVQSRQQPAPAATPEQPEVDPLDVAWGAPQFDPAWMDAVVLDEETGEYKAKQPWVPFEIVKGVNDYYAHVSKKSREYLTGNPYKQTWQAITPKLDQYVQQRFNELQQQQAQQQFLVGFEQQNAGWMYQADATGNTIRDPRSNQPVLTPLGNRFVQWAGFLKQNGMTDPQAILLTATEKIRGELAEAQLAALQQQQQQPPAQAQATPQPLPAHVAGQEPRPAAPTALAPPAAPQAFQVTPPLAWNAPAPLPMSPEQVNQQRLGSFMANAQAAFQTPSASSAHLTAGDEIQARSDTDLNNWFRAALTKASSANGGAH